MRQLRMKRLQQPIPELRLQEKYRLRTYREGDAHGWIELCGDDLGTADWTEEDFREKMLGRDGILPEGIFFVTDKSGKMAATATGIIMDEPGQGYLHMVDTASSSRGQGLGRTVCAAVIRYLESNNCGDVILDTDDFRIPAIKLYVSLGFKPVIHDDGMETRWAKVLGEIGQDVMGAYTEDGKEVFITSEK